MNIKKIGSMGFSAQDGAIWGDFMFRFDHGGHCRVYDARALDTDADEGVNPPQIASFSLNPEDAVIPHCNAVTFGTACYAEDDEFPLMYANVYNNYAREENRREGMCCVYRLKRQGANFSADLVATLEVAFTGDSTLWRSPNAEDIRPYGNFTVDSENKKLYVFTMRDESHTTRYFRFPLPEIPKAHAGVQRILLRKIDIEDFFDCEYHHFIQGACVKDGKIYSLEGFTDSKENPPAMRIISTENRRQEACIFFGDHGLSVEPELIDFSGNICYYCDHSGNLYTVQLP
jgi:hypothetical protein